MKRRISEALNELDEKYLQEAIGIAHRRSWVKWIALAASLVLVVGLGIGFYPKPEAPDDGIVLPPCRVGEGKSSPSLAHDFHLISACEDAEAVAWLRIGNWLGEGDGVTYYEAEVIRSYKGDLPENIVFQQDGCSRWTFGGYPLFTYGNEILVFLKKKTMEPYMNNGYWVAGAFTTVADIVRDEAGVPYVRGGFFFELLLEKAGLALENHPDKTEGLLAQHKKQDPYRGNMLLTFGNAYQLEDVEQLILRYIKE